LTLLPGRALGADKLQRPQSQDARLGVGRWPAPAGQAERGAHASAERPFQGEGRRLCPSHDRRQPIGDSDTTVAT
jgi:hypothetical protein